MRWLNLIWIFARVFFIRRANLVMENLALRQQLGVLQRSVRQPMLSKCDRIFWTWLQRLWLPWRSALFIVQPDTVVLWHRRGFKLFWRWKSRRKYGRPKIEHEIRNLIRRMSRENPTWGVPHITSELALLGHDVAESTVAKYVIKHPKPPSRTWRTFLKNHASDIVACDFFTVYTVTFRIWVVKRAGLKPWTKLSQNLRSSRETELAEEYPVQVVCSWIGNSPQVAARHCLQTTEDHFKKAVQDPVQHPAAGSRTD